MGRLVFPATSDACEVRNARSGGAMRRGLALAALTLGWAFGPAVTRAGETFLSDDMTWVPDAIASVNSTVLAPPPVIGNEAESAKIWALHKTAVIQAASGDVTGAKNTAAQIADKGRNMGPVTGVWFLGGRVVYNRPPVRSASMPVPFVADGALTPGYNYDGSTIPGVWFRNNQPVRQYDPCLRCPPPSPCACDAGSGPCSSAADCGCAAAHSLAPSPARVDAHDAVSLPEPVAKPASDLPPDYLASHPSHGPLVEFRDEYDRNGTRVTLRKYADGYAVIETPHAG